MNENQRKKINARSGLPNPLHVCGYGSVPRVRYLAMSIQAERVRTTSNLSYCRSRFIFGFTHHALRLTFHAHHGKLSAISSAGRFAPPIGIRITAYRQPCSLSGHRVHCLGVLFLQSAARYRDQTPIETDSAPQN